MRSMRCFPLIIRKIQHLLTDWGVILTPFSMNCLFLIKSLFLLNLSLGKSWLLSSMFPYVSGDSWLPIYILRGCTEVLLEGLHAGVGLTMDGLQHRNMGQGFLSYSRGQPNWPVPAGMGSASLRLISKLWLRAWKPGCQQPVSQGRVESRCPHPWK